MEQFIYFVTHHWLLWAALVVVVTVLVLEETKGSFKGVKKISPREAVNLINSAHAVVVDLRKAEEFAAGHITDAINIESAELEKSIHKLNKHKNQPIIFACDSGQSSLASAVQARKQGFSKVYALAGGIVAWKRADLPLITARKL